MDFKENEKIINNIKVSMEMENQFLTDRDVNILNDFASDKITMADAISTFKKMTF